MSNLPLSRGQAGQLVFADQADATTPASTGFVTTPFYTEGLSESEPFESDPIIGGTRHNARDERQPAPGLASASGPIKVPMCFNNIGWWLVGAFGDPVTTTEKATGSLVFSDQPGDGSTITINGTAFTLVSGSPGADEIQIGGALGDTITAIKTALNASVDADVAVATYDEASGTTVTIEHDTAGPTGNAFTLAASAASNATVSAVTLEGGCYAHTFASGSETLPSRTIGMRKRIVSGGDDIWLRTVGVMIQSLRFGISREAGFRRVGIDTLGISQGKVLEAVFGSPAAALDLDQVAAAVGVMRIDGVDAAALMRQEMTYSNGLAPDGTVNGSKYDSGFVLDGVAQFTGSVTTRYSGEAFYDWAQSREDKALELYWSNAPHRSLTLSAPACRAEPHGLPISGPGGMETQVNLFAHQSESLPMLSVVLRNALNGYPVV